MDVNRLLSVLAALATLVLSSGAGVANAADAQQGKTSGKVTVTGTVVDASSVPVIGATVLINNNPSLGGAQTDTDGRFTISVPVGATLVFSCMGYETQEVPVKSAGDLFITLAEDSTLLDEVVVVGFGTQTKESLVGSISQVKSDELMTTGSNSLVNSLTGKVAGLSITSPSSGPGMGENRTRIMIRGVSTWSGITDTAEGNDATNNMPLIMVDGVERSMLDLNPSEIESVSVLKDASATAVFGSKGANGVILVTTKSGALGKPKMRAQVEYGISQATGLPTHVDAATTLRIANEAYRNGGAFASQYSDEIIRKYADQSDPLRYPDTDWFKEIFKPFSSTYNANFDISGGTDKFKYFGAASYYYEGSPTRNLTGNKKATYDSSRINYRLNMDMKLTSTTTLSFKFGGSITTNGSLGNYSDSDDDAAATRFVQAYMSSGLMYKGYFSPEDMKKLPDPNYPGVYEVRLMAKTGSGSSNNPMSYFITDQFYRYTNYVNNTDLILKQDLGFITKGLSAKGTVSLSTQGRRNADRVSGGTTYPTWEIDWAAYDNGSDNVWISKTGGDNVNVYKKTPITEDFQTTLFYPSKNLKYNFYLEGGLNYSRSFGYHNVAATAIYNQRQYNLGVATPRRNQSAVGRVTYNYKKKYLFEANLGITGSEQFAPKNRYGFFPSVAVGYTPSKEKFWKEAMPWWSTMKMRYSYGLTGYDTSASGYLYKSAYTYSGGYYSEGTAANDGARWETAEKQDLGFEMAWFKDALSFNVDLYNEYRYDILVAPIVTPLVGVASKNTNSASIKKHGIEFELSYQKSFKNGFFFDLGTTLALTENRIVDYPDALNELWYRKKAGTPVESKMMGISLADGGYFNSVNDVHGYPSIPCAWNTVGMFKYLDYCPDGIIDSNTDIHVAKGSMYAPATYTINLNIGYKNLVFRATGTGVRGSYGEYNRSFLVPFYNSNVKVNQFQTNYWTPSNHSPNIQSVLFDANNATSTYMWAGSNWNYLGIDGISWRKCEYFDLSTLYLGYTFSGMKLQNTGIGSLTVSATCNNVFMFTDWPETNPQQAKTSTLYFPRMRILKLGVNVSF